MAMCIIVQNDGWGGALPNLSRENAQRGGAGMPLNGGNYVAPKWVDNAAPALDTKELQAMCDSIVKNQGDAAALKKSLETAVNQINQNLSGRKQVELTSYVGTGLYGAENPCSITASFEIGAAFALGFHNGERMVSFNFASNNRVIMLSDTLKTDKYVDGVGFTESPYSSSGKKSSNGKTFFWYSTSRPQYQLNYANETYVFLCVQK